MIASYRIWKEKMLYITQMDLLLPLAQVHLYKKCDSLNVAGITAAPIAPTHAHTGVSTWFNS